jgi:hypothetical protein
MFLLVLYHTLVGVSAHYSLLLRTFVHVPVPLRFRRRDLCRSRRRVHHYACARECAYLSRTLVHTMSAAI